MFSVLTEPEFWKIESNIYFSMDEGFNALNYKVVHEYERGLLKAFKQLSLLVGFYLYMGHVLMDGGK